MVSIGGPIFLIAVGAIIRYALNVNVADIDLDVVGLILMIAGVVTLLLSLGLMFYNQAKRRQEAADLAYRQQQYARQQQYEQQQRYGQPPTPRQQQYGQQQPQQPQRPQQPQQPQQPYRQRPPGS